MTKDNYFKPVEFDGFKVNSQISNPDLIMANSP